MAHVITPAVMFPCDATTVYHALCNLKDYPLWNSGMLSVSTLEPMRQGMVFRTTSIATGRKIDALIKVTHLDPDHEIRLENNTGAVAYKAAFILTPHGLAETEVTCQLSFEFRNFVLDLAKPVVESMATARIRGDLETLRALITAPAADGVKL